MSNIVTVTEEAVHAQRDLADARACIARLETELAAARPVVEAAVAAVEAHYADARLRELALTVRQFRACAAQRTFR